MREHKTVHVYEDDDERVVVVARPPRTLKECYNAWRGHYQPELTVVTKTKKFDAVALFGYPHIPERLFLSDVVGKMPMTSEERKQWAKENNSITYKPREAQARLITEIVHQKEGR